MCTNILIISGPEIIISGPEIVFSGPDLLSPAQRKYLWPRDSKSGPEIAILIHCRTYVKNGYLWPRDSKSGPDLLSLGQRKLSPGQRSGPEIVFSEPDLLSPAQRKYLWPRDSKSIWPRLTFSGPEIVFSGPEKTISGPEIINIFVHSGPYGPPYILASMPACTTISGLLC